MEVRPNDTRWSQVHLRRHDHGLVSLGPCDWFRWTGTRLPQRLAEGGHLASNQAGAALEV